MDEPRHFGSSKLVRTLSPVLVPVFIVYIFVQMTITAQICGYYFHKSETKIQFERKYPTEVHFVTRPFNNSIPEEVYFRLTRALPDNLPDNSGQSSCASHVRMLRGFPRQRKGYITLGLTTVPRERVFYLPKTLESILSNIEAKDREDIVIVVFLGSLNKTWVNTTLSVLDAKFAANISSGLIQIIQPEASVYPDFSQITKQNFNDSLLRVRWRTKQNIDYAYLFAYSEILSEYYMHIEDDVTVAKGFVTDIKNFVTKTIQLKQTWFLMEFSSLGFIGKLFRSSDLCTMKEYFLLFKDEKPCDLLINNLKNIKAQVKEFKNPKSLFQHFGVSSSLKGKIQHLVDKNFKDMVHKPAIKQLFKGKVNTSRQQGGPSPQDLSINFKSSRQPNPEAQIFSSMQVNGPFVPVLPYRVHRGGYFWAKSVKQNDFYRIVFESPVNITAIEIKTGHPNSRKDQLQNAVVKAGHRVNNTHCTSFKALGFFNKGEFIQRYANKMEISCLEILITKKHQAWVIINEIRIETAPTKNIKAGSAVKQRPQNLKHEEQVKRNINQRNGTKEIKIASTQNNTAENIAKVRLHDKKMKPEGQLKQIKSQPNGIKRDLPRFH